MRQKKVRQQGNTQPRLREDDCAFRRFGKMKIGKRPAFHAAALKLENLGRSHAGAAQDQREFFKIGELYFVPGSQGVFLGTD